MQILTFTALLIGPWALGGYSLLICPLSVICRLIAFKREFAIMEELKVSQVADFAMLSRVEDGFYLSFRTGFLQPIKAAV